MSSFVGWLILINKWVDHPVCESVGQWVDLFVSEVVSQQVSGCQVNWFIHQLRGRTPQDLRSMTQEVGLILGMDIISTSVSHLGEVAGPLVDVVVLSVGTASTLSVITLGNVACKSKNKKNW